MASLRRSTRHYRTSHVVQLFVRSYCARAAGSKAYTDVNGSHEAAVSSTPQGLSSSQREALESALRVDQAGELAADWIYRGQLAVLKRDRVAGPLIQVCFGC
jgi:3-demethoxyubiquinol 3-hydroxylase